MPDHAITDLDLFPPIAPYETGRLRREAPHVLYWEQSGRSGAGESARGGSA